jgi:hypothetical protein
MRRVIATAAALAALGTGCCSRSAAGGQPPTDAAPVAGGLGHAASQRIPGEYLVTLAPGTTPEAIGVAFGALGVKSVEDLGGDLYLVTVGEDPGPERMEALRAKDARVRAVQPNLVYRQ